MATQIESESPTSLEQANLEPRGTVFPSPDDWSDQILYFFLPDRFSDGRDSDRPLFERSNPERFISRDKRAWMEAGKRFTGGTLRGAFARLPYIQHLGATAVWLGPIWKQRADLQTYHGYGIQNFLDIDPRFGTRQDLRDLVDRAHELGIRVLLDVITTTRATTGSMTTTARRATACPFAASRIRFMAGARPRVRASQTARRARTASGRSSCRTPSGTTAAAAFRSGMSRARSWTATRSSGWEISAI